MSCSKWRTSISYLEDSDMEISTKDGRKEEKILPPKIKGKHYTNMEFLANAELIWLTPNWHLSEKYNPNSDDSYFQQCFQTLGKLGEGSFASVIKVKSLEDDRMYAMKISKEPFRNEYDRKMKIREVEHLKSLSHHPNIVTLHKAWEEDRFIFIQLELCEPSVEVGQALSEKSCWKVLADILQALDYIHESGRAHFDIKVENILLGEDKQYKLSDFGLMLKLEEEKDVFKEGDAKYVAPELISGKIDKFTPKADIFSLGIMMLELAGNLELPSSGDVWLALRQDMFPHTQTKHLSDDFFELLTRMMASDPAKRPSAREILASPKMKAIVEERKLMKLQEFLVRFTNPSVKYLTTFFLSCAWSVAVTMLFMLTKLLIAQALKQTIDSKPKNAEISCVSVSPTPSTSYSFAGCSEWSVSGGCASDESVEDLAVPGSLFSSTPMREQDEFDRNENVLIRKLKRMKRERSESLNSDGMTDSIRSSCASPERISPPPPQIVCDWVGLTSPDKSIKERSVNRNKLHCPSESLLQYGISPLRLSKACKRDYREKKRLRSMTPRNLTRSFDEEEGNR